MRHFLLAACLIALAPSARAADDYPARKPGLWEMTMNGAHGMHSVKMCIDAATDAQMFKMGQTAMGSTCSRHDVHRNGNVVITDSVCQMGSHTLTSHGVITFADDTSYTTDITSQWNPAFMGKTESHTSNGAKWTGPCPADMQPGDMMTPMGKMNILQMQHPGAGH